MNKTVKSIVVGFSAFAMMLAAEGAIPNVSQISDNSIVAEAVVGNSNSSAVDISKCTVSVNGGKGVYFTGSRLKPSVVVKYKGEVISSKNYTLTYTDNLMTGTGKVKIKGKNKLKGTKTYSFKINPRNIGNCSITCDTKDKYYNGSAFKPGVKVKVGGTEIYSGNYTVTYKNNVNAGKASVIIKGKNNLSGTKTLTFNIKQRSLNNCKVVVKKNASDKYNPIVKVYIGDKVVSSSNYTVNKFFGLSTQSEKPRVNMNVEVFGKGNLYGASIGHFYDIPSEWVSGGNTPIVASDRYTGNAGDSYVRFIEKAGIKDVNGVTHTSGIKAWVARWNLRPEKSWATATFRINGDYENFSGNLNLLVGSNNSSTFDTSIYFYDADTGRLLQKASGTGYAKYTVKGADKGKMPNVDVNIKGVKNLKVMFKDNAASGSGTVFGITEAILY